MRRVVVTGYGIVSCLGSNKQEVLHSLKQGKSGIRSKEEYRRMGLRSQVAGYIGIDWQQLIDRKASRFMGGGAAYAYLSMLQAIEDSTLTQEHISNVRTGLIAGSGGASSAPVFFSTRSFSTSIPGILNAAVPDLASDSTWSNSGCTTTTRALSSAV